ncbi:MAG: hypothetical protein JNL79_01215 [Myxococcales bacterium]|nr:hypothetical protein [Myxococcales bacterium]
MPKFRADDSDAAAVLALFAKRKGLRHLRVRRHVDTLVIESDDVDDPFKHARLRKVSVHLWRLEMPAGSRWDVLPDKEELAKLVDDLVTLYPWTLHPVGGPSR